MSRRLLAALVLGAVAVSGCTGKAKVREPTPLERLETTAVDVRAAWAGRSGSGASGRRAGLVLVAQPNALFTADTRGNVFALDPANGREIWRSGTGSRVAGGPGVSGDLVLVGTLDAEVIALSRADGSERWRSTVSSEVLAPPVGEGNVIVARAVDGRVYGLSAADGRRRWSFDRTVPPLTLRGLSTPAILGNLVMIGLDNGRVVALRLDDGQEIWEQVVATPTGRSELERLTDIDAHLLPGPDALYAVSYGGELAAINFVTGDVRWRRSIKSYTGAALLSDRLLVTDSDGVVWALDAATGAAAWRQEGLRHRQLSPPAAHAGYAVVSDMDGYVHYLSVADGSIVGRLRPLRARVDAPPLVADGRLYVMDIQGRIVALEAVPR